MIRCTERIFYQSDLGCDLVFSEEPATGLVHEVQVRWRAGAVPNEEAATARVAEYGDSLQLVYDSQNPDHLRIYGVAGVPAELLSRYTATRPPLEYDWGLLGLQKATNLGATDLGDIPEMLYLNDGDEVARRTFEFAYSTDAQGAIELTVTETPAWATNGGAWVSGPTKSQVYSGQRYNEWRSSARKRIWEALKTWLPRVLVELEEAADVPAGETLSGTWFGANHASQFALYLESGRKEAITQSLNNDSTDWLSDDVPSGTVPGLADGKTVRELILESLR